MTITRTIIINMKTKMSIHIILKSQRNISTMKITRTSIINMNS